jgi:PKD repeat protein
MKTTGKWVLVISLLAMVVLMITPVSAYVCTSAVKDLPCVQQQDMWSNSTGYTFSWTSEEEAAACEKFNATWTGSTQGEVLEYCSQWMSSGIGTSPRTPVGSCAGDNNIMELAVYCDGGTPAVSIKWAYRHDHAGSPTPPVASFTCAPTTQGLSSSVVCTDSSTGNIGSYYWVIDDETRDIHPLQTSTSHDYTWQSAYAGLYSVSLRVSGVDGIDWENKSNYVTLSGSPTPTPTPTPGPTVAPGYVRSTFITKSATTWNTIHGSNIMLYDTYSHTWMNSTSDADGTLYIDTLPYTTINAYATFTIFANEYADASVVANADVNGGTFIILMYPISSPPPVGSVNLFVSTMDGNNNVLRDVTVTAVWDGYPHTGSSGAYGTAQWVVPNNTQVRLTGSKVGYDGAEEIIDTGEGPSYSVILYLDQQHTTPTLTPTPGGTVPTTVGPYGTPGPSGTMASGYTNTQGQRMLDFLATNGMGLVELCFMVTILGLLGVKLGK